MPRAVTAGTVGLGLFGKLPARGDFVRAGLPRTFVEPWDAWLTGVLAGSRALMGEGWLPAWLEAPVWRFSLTPGTCGPHFVLGLMLPSVDRVGRYFPLTVAAIFGPDCAPPRQERCDQWLDQCETAGRAALEGDAAPDQVTAMVPPIECGDGAIGVRPDQWWTEGSPRVEATRLHMTELPDATGFSRMLGADMLPEKQE